MEFIVLWFGLSIVAGVIAGNKGRSAGGFFLLSLLLSPLIGIITAAAATPNNAVIEQEQMESGQSKKCPFCAEIIKHEAIVCRYCGKDLAGMPIKKTDLYGPSGERIVS